MKTLIRKDSTPDKIIYGSIREPYFIPMAVHIPELLSNHWTMKLIIDQNGMPDRMKQWRLVEIDLNVKL